MGAVGGQHERIADLVVAGDEQSTTRPTVRPRNPSSTMSMTLLPICVNVLLDHVVAGTGQSPMNQR
jgi:hypothetical protein